ncbi:hypothetical protein AB0280_01625 [Pseudarthrobacter sp902506025]|uniref:Flavin reductase (DIM6/NTAB) family NADH-FMN oxidoreductase RutF n=1 Tax=Pseudarthrobacter defluvii TaxID=410837 RepID=A0ABT9UI69_9MICC|nr:hypothetical protein [Pseudarthrobacter defluvii]MDQ0118673.1 flavin reductase (DIM6/NTAB) family NADH-FMN oxidoreductase RutF [Pseudarthrobacter defluvii]
MATHDLGEAVNISAMALPFEENELDRAGTTKRYAKLSPTPMVAEPSPLRMQILLHPPDDRG